MKITMYELLGMIKDGKAPKKIKYDNDIWIYDKISRDYILIDKSGEEALICGELNLMFALNDEVEILEEPKGIPKKLYHCCMETNNEQIKFLIKNMNNLVDRYNELLDYLESKGE